MRQEVCEYGTTTGALLTLAGHLHSLGVTLVAMEATGYWKGPFYRLEVEVFECVLADARQVKHLPGRPKHDPGDSRWLAACFERGAITSCFVATEEFRLIRLHTRHRRDLTAERTREKQHAPLEPASDAVWHGVRDRSIRGCRCRFDPAG